MEFLLTSLICLCVIIYHTRPMTISRITKKLNVNHESIDINFSALTILLDYGYPEDLITRYYLKLSKFLERVKRKSDSDIYNYKRQLIAEFEKIHNSEPEVLARQEEEKRIYTESNKIFKFHILLIAIMLTIYLIMKIIIE
ncbi:hypothetical protein SRM1_04541 [Pseudomonas fluorescens]|nr:hypothetical protein SRM1_04541 [Pseudomonas fluorescens]